jgi:glycosyltransferase involved in cell wall biosynthesis
MIRESPSVAAPRESVVVITPSVGRAHLGRCVSSVQEQNYDSIEHLVVVDGAEFADRARQSIAPPSACRHPIHLQVLPHKTGLGRYKGYRICAAFSYLVNADIVFFLDDDNWFDPNHVSSCVDAMNRHGVEWAFALRRICTEAGANLIDDDCDSLGFWRRDASYRGPSDLLEQKFIDFYSTYPFLVDTNCFAIKRALLTEFAPFLLDGDCSLSTHLVRSVAGACSGLRTVNYRARTDSEERLLDYFLRGNRSAVSRYCGNLPWRVSRRCEPLSLLRTNLSVKATERSETQSCDCDSEMRNRKPGISQHPDRPPS